MMLRIAVISSLFAVGCSTSLLDGDPERGGSGAEDDRGAASEHANEEAPTTPSPGDPGADSPNAGPFAITLAKDGPLRRGLTLAVDVAVGAAHSRELTISPSELPAGVTATPITIPPKAEKGTLVLTASASAALGPFELVVRATDGASTEKKALRVLVAAAAGTFDVTFGDQGTIPATGNVYYQTSAKVLTEPSGAIVFSALGPQTIRRFTPAGALDTSFATNGSISGWTPSAMMSPKTFWASASLGSAIDSQIAAYDRATGQLVTSWFSGGIATDHPLPYGPANNAALVEYRVSGHGLANGGVIVATRASRRITSDNPEMRRTILVGYDAAGKQYGTVVLPGKAFSVEAEGPTPGAFVGTWVEFVGSGLDTKAVYHVEQYSAAGTLTWATAVSGFGDLAFQGDKLIVAAAGTLKRYSPSGTADATFTAPAGTSVLELAVDSRGRIVALHRSGAVNGIPSPNVLARYLPTGALDTSFGAGGTFALPFYANTVAVDLDDRIVVAGSGTKIGRVWP